MSKKELEIKKIGVGPEFRIFQEEAPFWRYEDSKDDQIDPEEDE